MIVIISIFVLTESLQRTGVTEQVGNILLKVGGTGELRLTIVVMIAGAFLSLFMNNIASAAVLLPAMSGLAKRSGVNTSRLLIPLAFSTILGGTATLFTTSNIILNSVLRDNELPVFGLTDFAYVGVPIVIVGIIYVAFVGRNSLPGDSPLERTQMPSRADRGDLIEAYGLGDMLFKARVPEGSSLIDKTIAECSLREDYDVNIVGIERNGKRILHPTPQRHIRHGDILVLEGDEADFRRRDIEPFMEFLPETEWRESDLESNAIDVVEAMLAPRSRLIGKTIRDAHFREKYGMSVLAIWHGDREVITDLGDEKLHFGDALLLQGPRERLHVMKDDPDIIVLASDEEAEITVPGKGRAA
ncbi:MAG: putative transporter [Acidobacteria bacterium OLB17]|nr:MAG: putative transporter [Acidobacteria bacterium OLB17]